MIVPDKLRCRDKFSILPNLDRCFSFRILLDYSFDKLGNYSFSYILHKKGEENFYSNIEKIFDYLLSITDIDFNVYCDARDYMQILAHKGKYKFRTFVNPDELEYKSFNEIKATLDSMIKYLRKNEFN